MAEKETKQKTTKSTEKAETNKTATVKSNTAKPAAAKSTAAKSTTAKPAAAKPTTTKAATEIDAKKTAKKAEAASAAKPVKNSEDNSPKSVVEKYSNSRGKETAPVVATVPTKKAPKSENTEVAKVVEKHANTRGKKVTIVNEMRERKADAFYNAPSTDGAAAINTKTQNILLYILIGVLVASLLAGVILTIVSLVTGSVTPFAYAYSGQQEVGYYGEQVGTVQRYKPVEGVHNEGLSENYPIYGNSLTSVLGDNNASKRDALVAEACYLTAYGTWNGYNDRFESQYVNNGNHNYAWMSLGKFTWMDKDGYLYSGTTNAPVVAAGQNGESRQLYKHTASVGLYGGDVDDNEQGIIKDVTMRYRGYDRGYGITGVYAPAGEVIKIELSKADMEATGGIVIHIGQALYNGKANDIWTAKNVMNRMPVIMTTWTVDKNTSTYDEATETYTAYVGSFFGGPIYIRNERATFTARISGAVAYSHFILGYTTPEEFEQNAKSSAPYFDLEVWSYGVLHSGPKKQIESYSYDNLYNAAVLWEKVALVSTTNSLQGIVFLYDTFVAAGAAVAFPGQGSVNCPEDWMRGALNYKGIVSDGSWGNFHEYHHNFQGYGVGDGGEVTNNGMTLVSYALFTEISSMRGIGSFGAAGMGGWNRYTSATWALEQTLKIARENESPENGNRGLALYATLLHNFGADNYIQAKVKQQKTKDYGENYEGYMQAWQDVTHYNMTYFFNDILQANVGEDLGKDEYPMFVPVSSVYQTGRGIISNGSVEYIQTMQPYVINYGEEFTIDLRQYSAPNGQYSQGSIVLPDGFKFTVKNVSQPENGGSIKEILDENGNPSGLYKYKPNKKHLDSGKIIVTLGITKDDNAFEVADVELVLGFKQTHENNKFVLDRTIYTYSADKMYADAEKAYEAKFAGYTSEKKVENSNPTQNANTDIWLVTNNEETRAKYPDASDSQIAQENTIMVVEGKLYFEDAGTYRIYLRGRQNCALYCSSDGGKTYELSATIKDDSIPQNSALFRPNDKKTYVDVEAEKDSWLYFKEVLIVENANSGLTSFIGLGVKQWQEPMFTTRETYYDRNGKEVTADSPDKDDSRTVTKYYNYLGIEVPASEANKADPIPPTGDIPYANAYRTTYEKIDEVFTSDYFYTRDFSYDYKDNEWVNPEQTLIYTDYKQGMNYGSWEQYKAENIADGDRSTLIHTNFAVTAEKPLQFVFDMGEAKTVNRMTVYTQYRGANDDWLCPREMTLEGSLDGNTFFDVDQFENDVRATAMTFDFNEATFRYYRLTVTRSDRLLIIAEVEMWHVFELNGGKKISPMDTDVKYYGKWSNKQAFSDFGQVMVGQKNSNVKYEFEGTRFGILSSQKYGANFEVYIDGVKVESDTNVKPLAEQDGAYGLSYLSGELEDGVHTVSIKCTGEANIDALVIYQ